MDWHRVTRNLPSRFVGAISLVTILLTAGLIGVVGLLSGGVTGLGGRIPYYVLATAIAFLVSLIKLDDESLEGTSILIATSGLSIASGVLFGLAVEGIRYGVLFPGRLVASHLIVYFLSAALICTGLGMWSVHHWREFAVDEAEDEDE